METQVNKERYLAFIERAFKAENKGSLEYQYFVELQNMNEKSLHFRERFTFVKKRIERAINRLLSSIPTEQEKADLMVMRRRLSETKTMRELNSLLDFGVNRTFRFGLLPKLFS